MTRSSEEEEIEEQFFRMNISDATARTAMLRTAKARAARIADKYRETRARRAELKSLVGGENKGGYF